MTAHRNNECGETAMDYCPLCQKQTLPKINIPDIEWNGGDLFYQGQAVASFGKMNGKSRQANLLEICLRHWPNYVPYERCIFAVWPDGDEPEGDVMRSLVVNAAWIRRKIAPSGFFFYGRHGGYKVWLPDEKQPVWFTKTQHFRTSKGFRTAA